MNRLRALFAGAALSLASLSAHAMFIQMDLAARPQAPSHWTFPGARPAQITASLLFDTSSILNTNITTQVDGTGTSCLGHFDAAAATRILDVSGDGSSVFGNVAGSATLTGDHPTTTCNAASQSLFSGLSFNAGDTTLFLSFDTLHAITIDQLLAASDPFAALLLSGSVLNGFLSLVTAGGNAAGPLRAAEVTFRQVPEPAMLGLMGLSLLLLAVQRRGRTARHG